LPSMIDDCARVYEYYTLTYSSYDVEPRTRTRGERREAKAKAKAKAKASPLDENDLPLAGHKSATRPRPPQSKSVRIIPGAGPSRKFLKHFYM
jgi:hypothetical protein